MRTTDETTLDLASLRAGAGNPEYEPVRLSGRLVGKDAGRFQRLVIDRGLGPSKVVQAAVSRFLDHLEEAA